MTKKQTQAARDIINKHKFGCALNALIETARTNGMDAADVIAALEIQKFKIHFTVQSEIERDAAKAAGASLKAFIIKLPPTHEGN